MNLDKAAYIDEQVKTDYVMKSKNSALAFMVVAILFYFLNKPGLAYKVHISISTVAVFLFSALRLINVNRYSAKKISLDMAVQNNSITASLNALAWCAIGFFSVLSYYENVNIQIITTFIILIALSASSVVTLSHRRNVFLFLSLVVLLPHVGYTILDYMRTKDTSTLWLLIYTAIHIIYNTRQAKVIQNDMRKNFSNEFDLKKSLEEVVLSKKSLEEESIKTFHASRLSSLGEMAGGVAHEINNPLTIIQATAKIVLTREVDNISEESKSKLEKVIKATERIAKIVRSMKIIASKNDLVEHEVIQVSKVLELSLDLFEERLRNEKIDFKMKNSIDHTIKCNSLQVSQIIINLLSNAIDAIIKDKSEHPQNEYDLTVDVSENASERSVEIRVINSGALIPDEIAAKIFEPFYSTKDIGKGTGLGLSISQTLAQANNGLLIYEVHEGKVCFRLHLPIFKET